MTEDAPDSDPLENIRRMLPPQAATAIGMPGICLAACRRSGLCRFNRKIDGAPLCTAVMTAGEQDFCGRIVDLARRYLTPEGFAGFDAGIRRALSGGDATALWSARLIGRCFLPGNEIDVRVAQLRREVRAAKAAISAARRTDRRKARRARKEALSLPPACPAAQGEETHLEPPPLPLLPAGGEKVPPRVSPPASPATSEERMRGTLEADPAQTNAVPGTAPASAAENAEAPAFRIRPLDRPPLVP